MKRTIINFIVTVGNKLADWLDSHAEPVKKEFNLHYKGDIHVVKASNFEEAVNILLRKINTSV